MLGPNPRTSVTDSRLELHTTIFPTEHPAQSELTVAVLRDWPYEICTERSAYKYSIQGYPVFFY